VIGLFGISEILLTMEGVWRCARPCRRHFLRVGIGGLEGPYRNTG